MYRMEKGVGEEFLTKEKVQWAEAGDRSRSITPKPHMLYFAFSTFDFISTFDFFPFYFISNFAFSTFGFISNLDFISIFLSIYFLFYFYSSLSQFNLLNVQVVLMAVFNMITIFVNIIFPPIELGLYMMHCANSGRSHLTN